MLGSAALWGAGSALAWGFSDFIARFAGRSVGAMVATFAMMVLGGALVVVFMAASGEPFDWHLGDLHWLVGIGLGTALGSMMFFYAVTHGPVSLAVPLVSVYPVVAVLVSVILGARPEAIHWGAMAVTMAGVWVVARTVSAKEGETAAPEYAPAMVRRTIFLSLGAAAVYGASLTSADRAIEIYGPWQTILVVRIIGMLVVGSVVMLRREPVRLPRRSWPLLLGFALLDTLGHLLLYTGIARENGELAMVTSSAYVVITVILARVFLREPVSPRQWGGVVLVVGGIAVLAGFG